MITTNLAPVALDSLQFCNSTFLETSLDGSGYRTCKKKKWTRWGLRSCLSLAVAPLDNRYSSTEKGTDELRSWVQLPPGPFLPVVQIRYCFEFNLDNCLTKPPTNQVTTYVQMSMLAQQIDELKGEIKRLSRTITNNTLVLAKLEGANKVEKEKEGERKKNND